jgi:predicted transcriptional regulator
VSSARDFLSTRVVTVGPEQRLRDVTSAIIKNDALYCAVVSKSGVFTGLVRFKEVVARSADRIFSDLVPAQASLDINENLEAELVVKLLQSQGVDELVVLTSERRYVGLVTRESVFEWWVQQVKKS